MNKLGEGSYGIVYKAEDTQTGNTVALKKIRWTASPAVCTQAHEGAGARVESHGIPSTALREISVLLALNHPNVVKLHNCNTTSTAIWLVFEYVDIELKKFLDKSPVPPEPLRVRSYLQQLLQAIDYCHGEGVMHRDIKPQNILVTKDEQTIKLADFGLAREVTAPYRTPTHEVVTLWYRSIEILLGMKRYTYAADLWSTGCVFAEMVTTNALFPGDSEIETIFKVFRFFGTPNADRWPAIASQAVLPYFQASFPLFPEVSATEIWNQLPGLSSSGLDLFLWLMHYNPNTRPTAEEALGHRYFSHLELASVDAAAAP